jgi:hypothetical protein
MSPRRQRVGLAETEQGGDALHGARGRGAGLIKEVGGDLAIENRSGSARPRRTPSATLSAETTSAALRSKAISPGSRAPLDSGQSITTTGRSSSMNSKPTEL